jgi:hypothetical protein
VIQVIRGVVAIVALLPLQSFAYNLSNQSWSNPTTTFRVNIAGGSLRTNTWNTTFQAAMNKWNLTTNFHLVADLGVHF